MGSLGAPEIIGIILILLVLFGGKKIPELMRGLGTGVKEFKKATDTDADPEPRRDRERGYDRLEETRAEERRLEDRRLEDERRFAEERRLEDERRSGVR